LLCHRLQVDADGFVSGIRLRQDEAKGTAARAFRQMGYWVIAVGDSFNDVQMLHHADCGMWLDPPPALAARYPELPCLSSLSEVRARLEEELRGLCID
jgi:phosphoserine/homoserine phosphotransferase